MFLLCAADTELFIVIRKVDMPQTLEECCLQVKQVVSKIEILDSNLHEKTLERQRQISELQGGLIRVQQMLQTFSNDIVRLQHAVNGNGREGLIDRMTKLEVHETKRVANSSLIYTVVAGFLLHLGISVFNLLTHK